MAIRRTDGILGRLRAHWSDLTFALLVAWTMVATSLVFRRTRGDGRIAATQSSPSPNAKPVKNAESLAGHGHAIGVGRRGPSTSQRVVVFSDFQCPFCRTFSKVIDTLRMTHPEVRIVERQFPLVDLHEAAYPAALAAECAGDVGRYAQMRSAMFERRGLVEDQQWGALAARAGIQDTSAINACVTTRRHAAVVDADIDAGRAAGIVATPSIIIGDSLFTGALPLADLERRLRITMSP
jgi:protein-disulfide isomerase